MIVTPPEWSHPFQALTPILVILAGDNNLSLLATVWMTHPPLLKSMASHVIFRVTLLQRSYVSQEVRLRILHLLRLLYTWDSMESRGMNTCITKRMIYHMITTQTSHLWESLSILLLSNQKLSFQEIDSPFSKDSLKLQYLESTNFTLHVKTFAILG